MQPIKVKVKNDFNHPAFKEILPKDFQTELLPKLSDKPRVVVRETTKFDPATKKHTVINPAVIQEAGTYEGFTFVGANGKTYNDRTLMYIIGNVPLSKIFDKL